LTAPVATDEEVIAMQRLKTSATILLPPLAVLMRKGKGLHFRVNIFLTILGYIPGLVHAIWLAAHPDEQTRVIPTPPTPDTATATEEPPPPDNTSTTEDQPAVS
jgi:uncharacterized membrane protein YqaE (UPF0057 family)